MIRSHRPLVALAAGASFASLATVEAAERALPKQVAYDPDPAPVAKVNIGRVPIFTSEGIFCKPDEIAWTVDVHPLKWRPLNPVPTPAPPEPVERPAGVPEGAILAAGGLWLIPLADGTYARWGGVSFPQGSQSVENVAVENGVPVAAAAGATVTDPPADAVAAEARREDGTGPSGDEKEAERRAAIADEVNGMNVTKLKEALDAAKVKYETDANKPALQKLLLDHRLKG